MISYSWAVKKQLVVLFCKFLRAAGLDVWRDEEGSNILSEMKGATDERMAEAIELSHTVIICVSSNYKTSANCRQEGKYTNALYKRNKLNALANGEVIICFDDDDYHFPERIAHSVAKMNGEKTNSINKLIAILATNNNKIQKHNFILIRAQQKINIYYTGKIEAKISIE